MGKSVISKKAERKGMVIFTQIFFYSVLKIMLKQQFILIEQLLGKIYKIKIMHSSLHIKNHQKFSAITT